MAPPAKETAPKAPASTEAVTSAPLMSAAFFIGEACAAQNAAFMACKDESRDPSHCLEQGKAVTACAVELFKKLREHCNAEFTAHWTCLDSQNQMYQYCRREESKMNACVFEKLGLGASRLEKEQHGELPAWRKMR